MTQIHVYAAQITIVFNSFTILFWTYHWQ